MLLSYGAFTQNFLKEKVLTFIGKWQKPLESDNVLVRYKAKQFIEILSIAKPITEYGIDLYFAVVEKMTVYDGGRLTVGLLDGTDVECEIE